jgi:hypothetical protein
VPIGSATRASSLAMVLVTATGFAGGGGWTAGRAPEPVVVDDAAVEAMTADPHAGHVPSDPGAPAPIAAATSHEHHAHHGPAAQTKTAATHHHSHDCEKGICRCDSRCPPRRSGPCGGVMRSCSGDRQDVGLGPGPLRPFLLSAMAVPAPGFDRLAPPNANFTPLTRALELFSPPPRASSI